MDSSSTSLSSPRDTSSLPVGWWRVRLCGHPACGNLYCRERAMSPSDTPTLPPEVGGVITAWVPHSVRDADPAVLAAVMPGVRSLVAAVGPETPTAARRLLWALAPRRCGRTRRSGASPP